MQLPDGVTIESIEQMDIEELYDLLGQYLVREDGHVSGLMDRIRQAKAWLIAKRATIINAICKPEMMKSLDGKPFKIAIATLDGVLAAYTAGIPVSLISAIVLKSGLEEICGND